ncbi:uncharacterized protein BYT42DRAFT_478766, partial [Radiomyces spectabilis]|uniref:uncharacterized protein n=1 Tax=Radiomyces spectabilis TaxID=64574 RepID=UPI00221E4164
KKKIANDPFAGMDAFVDYQKEIERLKALVPKVETKKRPNGRPKSTGADTNPTSVISEEERIRFLEFVRSWTGGWKRWEGNGVTDLTDAGSLWARQTPWTCTV